MKKKTKLEQARIVIKKLQNEGVEVDERIPNKKWMIESAPSFFGCEGSHYVGIEELLEIEEMYEL